MKSDKNKADKNYELWKQSVVDYLFRKRAFKAEENAFKKRKEIFNKLADDFFNDSGETQDIFVTDELSAPTIVTVKRCQAVTINFDADKLENKLGKEYCQSFISKKYEVKDMSGLIEYLKSCGVNPKKFKSFLNITKVVNQKEIDQLFLTGKLSEKDVDGCYTTEKKNPYYTVTTKKKV
jgi:hypothetical protein